MASCTGGLVLSAPLTLALRGRMGRAVVKRLHVPCTPYRLAFRPVSMKRHLSASADKGNVAGTSSPKGPQGAVECTRIEAMLGLPVGGIAGLFGSLVGVGGGVIMVPMLTCKPLSLQARFASATSLVAVVGTGLVSATLYASYGQADLYGAAVLAAAAMATAPFGARAVMKISNDSLKRIMGFFLLLVAPSVPLRDMLKRPDGDPRGALGGAGEDPLVEREKEMRPLRDEEGHVLGKLSPGLLSMTGTEQAKYVALLLGTGGCAGFLSGLLGIGGGIIVTPLLSLASGMTQHQVVGTSMVAMIFPSAVSLYTHHTLGNVKWQVGRMLLVGSAAGAAVGANLAQAVDDKTMKAIFAAGMFGLGLKTLGGFKAFKQLFLKKP